MANDESDPVDSILENIRGSDMAKGMDFAHDRHHKGRGARRSLESEEGIDWELVEESDDLTAFGNNPFE